MAVRKHRPEDDTPPVHNNVIEAPITPRRTSVSESLRGRRIECGLEVEYVAQILKIRPAILIAIENGRFDELPGPAYAVGFVRSYATYLGLDAEALVVRFKTETSEIARRPHLEFPLPLRDSRVPTGPLLIICVLLAVITYGGWYYLSAKPRQLSDLTPSVPERLLHLLRLPPPQAPKPATDAAVAPATAPEAAPPAPQTVASAVPAPAASVAPSATPASTTAAPQTSAAQTSVPQTSVDGVPPVENKPGAAPVVAALPPAPDLTQPTVAAGDAPKAPGDTSYGAPDGQARVVLHATADSWVQVRDKGSNLLFTRVLKPGEHYNVPNQQGLTLIAGNAGGIDITVDGMEAPHIGDVGRVARNVSLDPDHLLGAVTHAN
jgi:cytoskeleton protein RodZ